MIFKTAWRLGRVVPLDQLAVDMPWEPWGDRGKGAFTTTRSRLDHRRLAFWPRHRQRLIDTLNRIGLSGDRFPLPTEGQLVEWVESLGSEDVGLRINGMESANGDLDVWAVARPLPITPNPTHLAVSREPVAPDRGLKLVGQSWRRRATDLAAAKGVWDVLSVNPLGGVVDCSRSNLLLRLQGGWYAPWSAGDVGGMLPGVVVTSLVDFGVAGAAAITEACLDAASEVVATNSVRGVVPIHAVDGRKYQPGPATDELRRWVEDEAVRHAAAKES